MSFKSIDGQYDIFIDGEKKGVVEAGAQEDFVQISPGKHVIKVVRQTSSPDFYYTLERNIEFLPSAQVEITWEAGPTLESSAGIIKYFTEISKHNGANVYIQTFPQNATVEFDSRKSEGNTFEIFDTATHTIKITNGDGFDTQSLSVNLTDVSTQKVLSNLQLVIEVYLYKQPFK